MNFKWCLRQLSAAKESRFMHAGNDCIFEKNAADTAAVHSIDTNKLIVQARFIKTRTKF